jgi:predicted ArsR family transcriptional regulator
MKTKQKKDWLRAIASVKPSTCSADAIQVFNDDGYFSISQIAKNTGVHVRTTRKHLSLLRNAGLVDYVRVSLPTGGFTFLYKIKE